MRKFVFAICTIAFSLSFQFSQAQCNADLYSEKSMKTIAQGFMYEKSFRVDGRNGRNTKIEYSCILSKDINYSFTMNSKDGGSNGMVFTLFDNQRNKVVTNHMNNKFFTGIEYRCKSTGIYFVNFEFVDSKSHCGAAVLAFRR